MSDEFTFEESSVNEFSRLKGSVYAPVGIDADMSDFVKINKADLIATLRHYEKTHVTWCRDHAGDLLYIEAHIK